MKFKIEDNWGAKLISEIGVEINDFNVKIAKDLSTGKNVILVGKWVELGGHGMGGSVFSIDVICAETDKKLNHWKIDGNIYQNEYILEIG